MTTQDALNIALPYLILAIPTVATAAGAYFGRIIHLDRKAQERVDFLKKEIVTQQLVQADPAKRLAAVDSALAYVAPKMSALDRASLIHDVLFGLKVFYGAFWKAEAAGSVTAAPVTTTVVGGSPTTTASTSTTETPA